MNTTTLGIDLPKNSFSIVGMNEHRKTVLRKTVRCNKLSAFIAHCPPCLIGMEACSGAHYWGREFTRLGHRIGIMAAKFVEPYRKGAKNDNTDAEAICEAVLRPISGSYQSRPRISRLCCVFNEYARHWCVIEPA